MGKYGVLYRTGSLEKTADMLTRSYPKFHIEEQTGEEYFDVYTGITYYKVSTLIKSNTTDARSGCIDEYQAL